MPTILTKKSDTPGAVPATANLTNAAGGAELAVNTADKRLFSINSSSAVIELGTNPSSLTCADASLTVARIGSLTVSSLSLTNATFASATITNLTSTSATISSALTLSGGTANGVLYLDGSKVATSGSGLSFDGTNFVLASGGLLDIDSTNAAVAMRIRQTTVGAGTEFNTTVTENTGVTFDCSDSGGAIARSFIWTAAGSEQMRLTSTGLGIGTASPGAKLEIAQANPTRGIFQRIYNSTAGSSQTGSQIQFTQDSRADWVIGQPAATDAFAFWSGRNSGTDGTERMRLDSSGNLGIGTTSPSYKLQVEAASASSDIVGYFRQSTNPVAYIKSGSGYAAFGQGATNGETRIMSDGGGTAFVSFYTGSGTERARITAAGELLVGTTTNPITSTAMFSHTGAAFGLGVGDVATPANRTGIYFRSTTENRIAWDSSGFLTFCTATTERARFTGGSFLYGCTAAPSSTVKGIGLQPNGTNFFYGSAVDGTGTIVHMEFYNPNGVVGSISTNGSATAYNIASDVRLKKNIVDSQDAGADVDALKVRAFDWKVDDAHVKYGFVAQELAAVAPEAVKVGDDGDEVTDAWGVDYSKLVPMLVKEIQSLRARVAQLEAR